jgi:hypothetical protein
MGLGAGGAKALGKIDPKGDAAILQRMRESGSSIYTGTRWDGRPELILKELAGDRVWVRGIRDEAGLRTWLKDVAGATSDVLGLAWTRPLEAVGAPLEKASRIAAFTRKERQLADAASAAVTPGRSLVPPSGSGLAAAAPPAPAANAMPRLTSDNVEAALASRRVTADFQAGGTMMKAVSTAVPFLNATTQASLEFADVAMKNPAKAMAAFATVAGAVIANEVYNRTVAPEDYADVSRLTKNTGIVILSDQEPPEGGKRGLLFLPLRGGMGAIVPVIRDAFARYHQEDPQPLGALFAQIFGSLTPSPGTAEGFLGTVTPPIAGLGAELMFNKDFYTSGDIVSKSMEGLPASEQYGPRTSDTSRFLSESGLPIVGGKPPVAIDHAVRGFSPGPGEALLGLGDMLLSRADAAPPDRRDGISKPLGPRDTPVTGGIAGRFVRTTGEERRNTAYEKADAIIDQHQKALLDMVRNSSVYQSATPDDQARMLRSAQDALIDEARILTGAAATPKDYGQPSRWRNILPGSFEEEEIADAISTPAKERNVRQRQLAARYSGQETPQYEKWSKERQANTSSLRESARAIVRE